MAVASAVAVAVASWTDKNEEMKKGQLKKKVFFPQEYYGSIQALESAANDTGKLRLARSESERLKASEDMGVDNRASNEFVQQVRVIGGDDDRGKGVITPALVEGVMYAKVGKVEEAQLRRELTRWSLGRWRLQFKDTIEIAVIAREEEDLVGLESFVQSGTFGVEGGKWALWQEGVLSVSHRLDDFEWIILASDGTVGPLASIPDIFVDMREEDDFPLTSQYVSNSIGGCCDDTSPFSLAYHADLFSQPGWLSFWEKMPFARMSISAGCGTSTPLLPRQNLVLPGARGADTSIVKWLQCLTSEGQIPLNTNSSLEELRRSYNPFFPLSALYRHFDLGVAGIDAALVAITNYVTNIWYPPRLTQCLIE